MPIAINSEKTVGTIIAGGYDTSLNVNGYLKCDGSLVSRTIFSRLFSVIGATYGNGDGSTTFALPDLVGAVPRGAGTSSGYTENVTVTLGNKDNDRMQGHWHDFYVGATTEHFRHDNFNNQIAKADNAGGRVLESTAGGSKDQINFPKTDTVNNFGSPRTANETKMKNVGVVFYIKY
jgi:microcystin-dependent protein